MGRRKDIIDIVQIAGFIAVVIGLWVAIDTMQDAKNQVIVLQDLVNASIRQSESIDNTNVAIQQQTITNAYNSAESFEVKIFSCSDSEKWDPDGNYLGYFYNFKPIIVTEDGIESTVPFRIFADLEFREKETRAGPPARYDYVEISLDPYVWDIDNPSGDIEVLLQPIFDQAEESGFKYVHVDFTYRYQPIDPTNDYHGFGVQKEGKPIVMALFKLHDNGKWHVEDFEEQYPCRS